MILGSTAYLIGLFAVMLPILIHLWSKKTRKTVPFGTIRFLSEDDTQAVKNVVPTEWLLLFLRGMLIAILVLIMSEPSWKKPAHETRMILIDPVYRGHSDLGRLIDSLQKNNEVRWFSSGFPRLEDTLSKPYASHWELLVNLESITSEVTILSPRRISQFVGARPLESKANWVSLPQEDQSFEVGDFGTGSSVVRISGTADQQSTYFAHSQISGPIADSLEVTVSIQVDKSFAALAEFVRASIAAINEDSPLAIKIVEEDHADWLIWLKDELVPNRRNLLYATRTSEQQILKKVSHDVYSIAAFQLEEFLTYNFPIRLEQVLGHAKLKTELYDWRELSESQLPPLSIQANADSLEISRSLSPWIWGLLILVFCTERYLSLKTTVTE